MNINSVAEIFIKQHSKLFNSTEICYMLSYMLLRENVVAVVVVLDILTNVQILFYQPLP